MCFDGGGDDSASREMIQMQKDEAAKVDKREKERQARIKQGYAKVKDIFEGAQSRTNVNRKFDWKTFKAPTDAKLAGTAVSGLPAGYKYVQIPDTTTTAGTPSNINPNARPQGGFREAGNYSNNGGGDTSTTRADRLAVLTGANTSQGIPRGGSGQGSPYGGANTPNSNPSYNNGGIPQPTNVAGTPATWGILGPDGKIYKPGDNLGYGDVVLGDRKNWQNDFLNDYRQSMLNFYEPQVAKQFGEAQGETIHRHANAGTLNSTGRIMNLADLSTQNQDNLTDVRNKAGTATDDMEGKIGDLRSAAEAQVGTVENPQVATDAASRQLKNLTAEAAPMNPLEEVFKIATIGAANFLGGSSNASRMAAGYGSGSGTNRNQTVRT